MFIESAAWNGLTNHNLLSLPLNSRVSLDAVNLNYVMITLSVQDLLLNKTCVFLRVRLTI